MCITYNVAVVSNNQEDVFSTSVVCSFCLSFTLKAELTLNNLPNLEGYLGLSSLPFVAILSFSADHCKTTTLRLIGYINVPRAVEAEKPGEKCTVGEHEVFTRSTEQAK